MSKTVVVTGVAGFIGSHFVRLILSERPDWKIYGVDNFSFAGRVDNISLILDHLKKVKKPKDRPQKYFRLIRDDIGSVNLPDEPIDFVVNFAAETHVDRSINDPTPFLEANIYQMGSFLENCRLHQLDYDSPLRFLQVSTDEVYGSLGPGGPPFWEESPIRPSSPYSASKAAADFYALSYHKTYGMDVVITRCGNNYGPNQLPEKLIPVLIAKAQRGQDFPVYGTGKNVRDWIFVEDHCRAILLALEKGEAGEIYNIGAGEEHTNLEIVEQIQGAFPKSKSQIKFVEDRPGHDWRYALNTDKIRKLGFKPTVSFEDGMQKTVRWYKANEDWVQKWNPGLPQDQTVLPDYIWW